MSANPCPKCGRALLGDEQFCPGCGEALAAATPEISTPLGQEQPRIEPAEPLVEQVPIAARGETWWRRPHWPVWAAAGAVAAVLVAGLVFAHRSGPSHPLTGSITVYDGARYGAGNGSCDAGSFASDLAAGSTVIVQAQDGTVVGTGRLSSGTLDGSDGCRVTFGPIKVPSENFYLVHTQSHLRDGQTVSRAALAADGWRLDLTIGDARAAAAAQPASCLTDAITVASTAGEWHELHVPGVGNAGTYLVTVELDNSSSEPANIALALTLSGLSTGTFDSVTAPKDWVDGGYSPTAQSTQTFTGQVSEDPGAGHVEKLSFTIVGRAPRRVAAKVTGAWSTNGPAGGLLNGPGMPGYPC